MTFFVDFLWPVVWHYYLDDELNSLILGYFLLSATEFLKFLFMLADGGLLSPFWNLSEEVNVFSRELGVLDIW